MLHNAILVLVISSFNQVIIDYELYEDEKYCQAVSRHINEYHKDGMPEVHKVTTMCVRVKKDGD